MHGHMTQVGGAKLSTLTYRHLLCGNASCEKAMKCPGISSSNVPLSDGDNDDDEWTDFGGPCSCDCHTPGATGNVSLTTHQQWTGQKKEESAFELCFPALRLPSVVLPKERKLLTDNDNRLQ